MNKPIVSKGVRTKVPGLGIKGCANGGLVKNLVGLLVPDLKGHGMAHVFSNTHPVAKDLRRLGGEMAVVKLDKYRFEPLEVHHGANITGFPGRNKDRLSVV